MNVVVTGRGLFVEVQGTAEGAPFDRARARRAARPRRSPAARELTAHPAPTALAAVRDARARVVLATHNAHKVDELQRDPRRRGLAVDLRRRRRVTTVPEPVEDGVTFAENALSRRAPRPRTPGCPRSPTTPGSASTCSAARPGIFSARWAGTHGDDAARTSRCCSPSSPTSRTSTAARASSARPRSPCRRRARGVVEGRLDGTSAARPARRRTASVTTRSSSRTARADHCRDAGREKNAISHRTRAFQALAQDLAALR